MRFSDALDEWLDHRAREPDETSGYTDKAFWRERARLAAVLDQFVPDKEIDK